MTTAADLAILRSHVGSTVGNEGDAFDDIDVAERIRRLGSADAAALEILRTIRADIECGQPASMTVSGDYAENWARNLDGLDARISELERRSSAGTVTVSRMVRPRRR